MGVSDPIVDFVPHAQTACESNNEVCWERDGLERSDQPSPNRCHDNAADDDIPIIQVSDFTSLSPLAGSTPDQTHDNCECESKEQIDTSLWASWKNMHAIPWTFVSIVCILRFEKFYSIEAVENG